MINTIIFDLDLTLVDSLEACTQGANLLAERFELPKVSKAEVLKKISLATADFWQSMWGESHPEWMRYFNEDIIPKMNHLITVYPGAEEFLTAAKEHGYLLAVGTNRTNPWLDLAQMNLAKYFDTAVGASDVLHPKPDPDILLTALKQLGSRNDAAVYIGDSLVDMAAGRGAGLKTIGLLQGGVSQEALMTAGAWMVRENLPSCRELLQF